MEIFTPLNALAGGALIGLAASLLLLFHGRIAGVSGILGDTLLAPGARGEAVYRLAFLVGLFAAGLGVRFLYPSALGSISTPAVTFPLVIVAGLLVGYGTRLGNGCTSGHGVCGISRLSKRSIVATMTFMAAGGVTVFLVRHVLGTGR
ncbi:MAG TPA: YeeE/YedE family protein [Labilithrix sp.]|nr:YeeE/YedE family protein [Labilithrix sp.]